MNRDHHGDETLVNHRVMPSATLLLAANLPQQFYLVTEQDLLLGQKKSRIVNPILNCEKL
jgi:hypothetical protein